MKRAIVLGAMALAVSVMGGSALAADGAAIYKAKCAVCHGAEGAGTPMAPAFNGNKFIKASDEATISEVTAKGREGAAKQYKQYALGMPKQQLAEAELKAVTGYLKGLAGK
ncbi:MAG: hypothetical protein A2W09_05595 [Deltaproteobacteria bacterium RBG_16_50_11]|nr:MAG: hypothetical protein A2W09_05595 [Deltaproteobacteria bacterium RBG_16_50_11]